MLFTDLIVDESPDVVAVTETWLDNTVGDTELTPDGYFTIRMDHNMKYYSHNTYVQDNRGGVLLLIKSCLSPILFTDADVEAGLLWVTLNPHPNLSWLVGVCYRPETDEQFMLNKITNSINKVNNDKCVLMGDFNFRNKDWSTLTGSSGLETQFLDCIEDKLLNQIVQSPTRGNNILDSNTLVPVIIICCSVIYNALYHGCPEFLGRCIFTARVTMRPWMINSSPLIGIPSSIENRYNIAGKCSRKCIIQ
jgi:hypothetical protein